MNRGLKLKVNFFRTSGCDRILFNSSITKKTARGSHYE